MLRQNVDDRGRVLKPDHADTLRSVYLLSRLLRERRRFDEARELAYRYAHDIQCAQGSNHPDRIVALTNQGDVARDQGQRDRGRARTIARPPSRPAASSAPSTRPPSRPRRISGRSSGAEDRDAETSPPAR